MRFVFFDLETTGVDVARDRIVEISMFGLGGDPILNAVVDPGVPIPPEATAVHGITNDDVALCPTFPEIAEEVQEIASNAILVGYNSLTFDTPLLDAELQRAGQPGLPRDEDGMIHVPEIDLYAVWQNLEPRTLVGAARRFAGVDLEADAHRADADARVLEGILMGMQSTFPGVELGTEELMAHSRPDWMVDRDGKFRREDDGTIVFGFGKHRGNPVTSNPSYLHWMLGADFGPETKIWIRRFLAGATV